jgi:hypothetical protein
MAKKRAAKSRAWNKGIELGQKDAFTPDQVKRIRNVLAQMNRTSAPLNSALGHRRRSRGLEPPALTYAPPRYADLP